MKPIGLLFILIILFNQSNIAQSAELADSQPWSPVAGEHYLATDIKEPHRPGVKFYFWPGSASCYQLEAALQSWQKQNPELIIERIPLVKRPQWRLFAKAWLTAVSLDKGMLFLNQLYKMIHIQAQQINGIDGFGEILTQLDIDLQEFNSRFNSLAINQQLKSIQIEADLYPVSGVPAIVINDRWYSDASMVGTSAQLIEIIETLALQSPQKIN